MSTPTPYGPDSVSEAILASQRLVALVVAGDSTVTAVRGPAEQLLGTPSAALYGKPWTELIDPEQRDAAKALIEAAHDAGPEGPPLTAALRLLTPEGTARDAEAEVRKLPGTAVVDQVLVTLQDDSGLSRIGHEDKHLRAVLEAITAQTQDTVLVLDALARVRDAYGSFERLGHWQREDMLGRSAFDFVHADDLRDARSRFLLNLIDLTRTGRVVIRLRVRTGNGEWLWVEGLAENRFADPMVRGIILTLRNINEQVVAQARLTEHDERFLALTRHARDLILIVSEEGRLRYMSESAERILGRSPASRLGHSAFENIHPDDLPDALGKLRRIIEDPAVGLVEDIEARIRHADGSWRWLSVTANNMLAHPAVRGVVVTARDITERMQAEIALAEGRIMLEVALEAAQAGLWWLDLEADRLERNATTERLVEDGHAGPLVWSQWLTTHRPNLRAGILEWLTAMRAQPARWHEIEYRVNREDGSPRDLSFRGRVLQTRDKSDCSRFAGTVVDVTEQRRLDEALRAAIDAEHERLGRELHDGLGQELVGLSLSTAGMINSLGTARPGLLEPLKELQSRLRHTIATARTLAHRIVPAAIESGGLSGALLSLAEVSTVAGMLEVRAEIDPALDVDLPAASATHLYRIAQEALSNAIRHGQARHVRIALRGEGTSMVLTIEDDGSGLPDSHRRSAGIGLRLMRHRAALVGGELLLEAVERGGTRVCVRIHDGSGTPPEID